MSQARRPSFHRWTAMHWMKLLEEELSLHGTPSDPIKRSAYFSGRNGALFNFRRVFVLCCPYSIWNRLVPKPAFVPRNSVPRIIMRMCTKLEK
jgi:hypothetical protein